MDLVLAIIGHAAIHVIGRLNGIRILGDFPTYRASVSDLKHLLIMDTQGTCQNRICRALTSRNRRRSTM